MHTISCHAHLSVELNLWGRYINLRFNAMFFSSSVRFLIISLQYQIDISTMKTQL